MTLPLAVIRGGYPSDPSNPSPYRCTIARPMGPRAREHRYNPFANAYQIYATERGVRDLFTMQTLETRRVILFPSMNVFRLGKVAKHSTAATIAVSAFDPSVVPPAIVPPATLAALLEPVEVIIFANRRNVYRFAGPPTFGVTFNIDVRGGETIEIAVNNTDPSSTGINGFELRWQLFLYSDPAYSTEVARKGHPRPVAGHLPQPAG